MIWAVVVSAVNKIKRIILTITKLLELQVQKIQLTIREKKIVFFEHHFYGAIFTFYLFSLLTIFLSIIEVLMFPDLLA